MKKNKLTCILCPCGSQKVYAQCCERWHRGETYLQAHNAKALMQSRYSAFVLHLPQYLLQTWHPQYRPPQIESPKPGLKWLGLQIHAFVEQDDTHATVSFTARYRLHGQAHRIRETSRFEKIDGRWLYLDGNITP